MNAARSGARTLVGAGGLLLLLAGAIAALLPAPSDEGTSAAAGLEGAPVELLDETTVVPLLAGARTHALPDRKGEEARREEMTRTQIVEGGGDWSWVKVVPVEGGGLWMPASLAPGAVEDTIASSAPAPFRVLRSDVVGRVDSFGVRDLAQAGVLRWVGLAQIEREDRAPSEAKDDTDEPPTTAVRGLVVGEDGLPIRGAEVILYSSFYLRQAFYDHRVRQIGRVLTDAEGVFDLRPVALDTVHFGAAGDVLVTVRHAHFPDVVAQRVPAIVPGRETDVGTLLLPARSVTVRGVVRDLGGLPVAGAVVRVSGHLNPVEYDKTERMIVLDACPFAVTDEEGAYVLTDFAAGVHEISVHVNIDCVLHGSDRWDGEREWSPRVVAGNSVRGRVVDPDGAGVGAAVVAGGGNWTPTNPDGTFWLDNVQAGPLRLEVVHHAWHTVFVPDVPTNGAEITVRLERPLARVSLTVVDDRDAPVPLVAIDWAWPPGQGPGPFAPDSRFWHDSRGVFALVVPEGAVGATVSDSRGTATVLAPEDLLDGGGRRVVLAGPPGGP